MKLTRRTMGQANIAFCFREDMKPFTKKIYEDKFGNSCGNIQTK